MPMMIVSPLMGESYKLPRSLSFKSRLFRPLGFSNHLIVTRSLILSWEQRSVVLSPGCVSRL